MIKLLVLGGLALCCALTFRKWWLGPLFVVVVGFAQDPLRKLIPGEPVYMVVLCAVVFASIVLALILHRYPFNPARVPGWQQGVATAMFWLVMVVSLHLVIAYLRTSSLFIVGLGMLNYLAPLAAIFTGYYYAVRVGEEGVERLLKFYAIASLVTVSGIYLEYAGLDWRVLGEVGEGLTIYDVGTALKAYSGFMRASEIAAWHIAFGSALMLILAVRSRSGTARALYVAGIILLLGAGLLTGRRKLVVNVVIFLTTYWTLMTLFHQRSLRVAAVILVLGLSSLYVLGQRYLVADRGDGVYDLYVERASGVFGDIAGRVEALGLNAVVSAVRRVGFIGGGAGTAGQGARFSDISGGQRGVEGGNLAGGFWETESGFGKVVVELGLLGLLAVIWLIIASLIHLWKVLLYLAYRSDSYASICYGLVALLVSSFAHFLVASQAFSDPFILILLGLSVGFIAASPELAVRKSAPAGQAAAPA